MMIMAALSRIAFALIAMAFYLQDMQIVIIHIPVRPANTTSYAMY
jgi:hypothetical protein